MGECLIVRRGGGQTYKLPVLNVSYPQDVTVVASASASATFRVQIAEPGNPAEYTYKWFQGSTQLQTTGSTLTYAAGQLTSARTLTIYCEVTNKAGTVTSRVATLTVKDWKPSYSYTGNHQLIDDGNYHWRIKCKSSGTLRFTSLGNASSIDVFCVGGGGGGGKDGSGSNGLGSGGGGYTKTAKGISVSTGTNYAITVGSGGAMNSSGGGGTTSAFGVSAAGGQTGTALAGGNGGSGGGGFAEGTGGSNGGNGAAGTESTGISGRAGGQGQGSTTREFGESSGTLYAGGGGGMYGGAGGAGGGRGAYSAESTRVANSGGGGGGQCPGTEGIVVIRNHR